MRNGLLFGMMMLGLTSCFKRVEYPNRPDVEYISHELYNIPDSIVTLEPIGAVTIGFTDGDGDLGLDENELSGPFALGEPYYYNLFVRYFEKENGVFQEVFGLDSSVYHVRFENLTPQGKDKTLEGEMEVGIFDTFTGRDTVRYEFFIVDRALQHSDTVSTPEIVKP